MQLKNQRSNLLNEVPQVPRVPESASPQVLFEYVSAQVLKCLKCPSIQLSFEFPNASSAQVSLERSWEWPSSAHVTFECPSSAPQVPQVLFECSSSTKVWSITGNGLLNSFLNFFEYLLEYIFSVTLTVFCLFRNNMCKFCYVLLARCNHSKGLSKTFLKYFVKFQKLNMMDCRAPYLIKL